MNESNNSGIEVNELCEEKYYSAKEILNDYWQEYMSNRTIEKTEKQSSEQAVEEPIIEKTDIKESVEEPNDVRKITIL